MKTGTKAAVSVAIIVLLLALSLAYSGKLGLPGGNAGTSSTVTGSLMRATVGSISGVQLLLSINATGLKSGSAIALEIAESNPSQSIANVSTADNWKTRNIGIGFGCEFDNLPISASVFKGYYTSGNISQATPLQIEDPSAAKSCPPLWVVSSWIFQPMSDVVELDGCLGSSCYSPGPRFSTDQVFDVNGAWATAGEGAIFGLFTPGVYTVAAGDEWGAIVLLHFSVSPP